MSGGKACGKQAALYTGKQADEESVVTSRDTTALLAELQALHHTHREATRVFFMAASQGATDAQIADALRQGLPHLTDPASLKTKALANDVHHESSYADATSWARR
jgi:hypothetical protein